MLKCAVKPYEGSEKYIFISYCHKDSEGVFPIIEQMASDGYRVWYDEGIDPGSEWPEVIAEHLNAATICIAFITANSVASHNCRKEISFACQKEKKFLSVFLEKTEMTPGMEMQLTANQYISKYTMGDREFFSKLYEVKEMLACKGMPRAGLRKKENDSEEIGGGKGVEPVKVEPAPAKVVPPKEEPKEEPREVPKPATKKAYLIYPKTNERIELPQGEYRIGRSEQLSDFVITGNSTISRVHAVIITQMDEVFIYDNSSLNKTFINSEELEPKDIYQLDSGDVIRLHNENFEVRIE